MSMTLNPVMVSITKVADAPVLTDELYARYRPDVHSIGTNHRDVGDLRISVLEASRSGSTSWSAISEGFSQLWEYWSQKTLGGVYLLRDDGDGTVFDNRVNETELYVSLFEGDAVAEIEKGALVARDPHDVLGRSYRGLMSHAVHTHLLEGLREETFAPAADLVVYGEGYEYEEDSGRHIRILSAAPGQSFEPFTPTPIRVSEKEREQYISR